MRDFFERYVTWLVTGGWAFGIAVFGYELWHRHSMAGGAR